MILRDIVRKVNQELAGEQLALIRLIPYLDEVIDDINANLNSTFPVFSAIIDSEYNMGIDYNYFPDEYIRKVVIKGAAYKFYIMDEEGESVAQQYNFDYQNALFEMVRDYIEKVPRKYRSDKTGSLRLDEAMYCANKRPFNFRIWS